MTIQEIAEKAKIKMDMAEVLYYHSIKLRMAKPTDNIQWKRLFMDWKYRKLFGVKW